MSLTMCFCSIKKPMCNKASSSATSFKMIFKLSGFIKPTKPPIIIKCFCTNNSLATARILSKGIFWMMSLTRRGSSSIVTLAKKGILIFWANSTARWCGISLAIRAHNIGPKTFSPMVAVIPAGIILAAEANFWKILRPSLNNLSVLKARNLTNSLKGKSCKNSSSWLLTPNNCPIFCNSALLSNLLMVLASHNCFNRAA